MVCILISSTTQVLSDFVFHLSNEPSVTKTNYSYSVRPFSGPDRPMRLTCFPLRRLYTTIVYVDPTLFQCRRAAWIDLCMESGIYMPIDIETLIRNICEPRASSPLNTCTECLI